MSAFDARYAIVARRTARERTLAAARSDDFHAREVCAARAASSATPTQMLRLASLRSCSRRLSTSLAAASASTSKSLAEVKAAAKAAALQEPLTVYARKRLGGRSPDILEKKGYIPAVIQGDFLPNQHIALDAKSLYALRRRRGFKTRMIALRMGDGEVIQCLPESLQETLDDGHIVRARPRTRGASQHRPRRPRGRAAAAARERRAAATREPRRRRRRRSARAAV